MSKPSRTLLRLTVQIAVWTLLMVALLGPHSSWSICLTGHCSPRAEAVVESCCCSHQDATDNCGEGDGENGAEKPLGCCVDLAMAIDEGPMPQPVQAPDVDHEVVAVLPKPELESSPLLVARFTGYGTGPPRTDRLTDLIATTILRE